MMGGQSRLAAIVVGTVLAVPALATAAREADNAPPTFTKAGPPIFQAKCEGCHRPDNMAPMALRTYEEVRPWVKSIAQRVGSRQMPPWHIDKNVGIQKFKNDRSLNDDQIALIESWIAAGAPKGDLKDRRAGKGGAGQGEERAG